MQYRRFGKTEMKLSVLTLGLMRYMSDDPDRSARVVQRAVKLGINHLETARGYGTSEKLLGHALKSIDRSQVYITTKVGPARTYDEFMTRFDTSMSEIVSTCWTTSTSTALTTRRSSVTPSTRRARGRRSAN